MSTVVIRRPPRVPPAPIPTDPITFESPPELPTEKSQANWMVAMPMVAGGGAMAFMVVGRGGSTALLGGGMMLIAMLSMAFMSVGRGARQRRGQMHGDRRDYLRYLDLVRGHVRAVAEQQRASLLWQHPNPGSLWTIAASRRLWERRATDADFGLVRVGVGPHRLASPISPPDTGLLEDLETVSAVALRRFIRAHSTVPNLPIALSVKAFSHVALVGEAPMTRGLARAMIAQLATLHSPDDVMIAVCASAEAMPDWDWVKWLPHAQHPAKTDGAGQIRLIADTWRQLEEWLSDIVADRRGFTAHAAPGDVEPLVVVVLDGGQVEAEALIAPGRSPAGMLALVLSEHAPPAADHTMRLSVEDGELGMIGTAGTRHLAHADVLSLPETEALARTMAPFRMSAHAGIEEFSADPLEINTGLGELLGIGDVGQLDVPAVWRSRAPSERLAVPLGLGADGQQVVLDLKESAQGGMGPHGLVIGATGSGKSELLRTLVLGLAVTHSSETLNLVLVDFKGGATFAGLAGLPHTAAVITNLQDDLTMVDRMRDAIAGELNRRQEVLRDAGNYASVRDYERARATGAELAPLPSLVIVCDEFSELLSAKPDFIDLFLAIGRLGRSLGVHLLLASQRLEEGRLRGLDSHLSYRVGLKTFSAAESRVVLGVPDAYTLPPIPGSGYLKFDTEMWRFKAAYVSGEYERLPDATPLITATSSRDDVPADLEPVLFASEFVPPPTGGATYDADRQLTEVSEIPLAQPALTGALTIRDRDDRADAVDSPTSLGGVPAHAGAHAADGALAGDGAHEVGEAAESVLEVVVDRLAGHGPPAHRVWLPPLDDSPTLDELLPPLEVTADRGLQPVGWSERPRLAVPIGVVDRPFEQRRDPLRVDLAGAAGHAVVVGAPQSGKSTVIRTLVTSLALTHTPAEIQFYCLDFGGGSLASLADLPHVGTVATRIETDTVRRLVAEVKGIVTTRERHFLEHRLDSMAAYRARRGSPGVDDGFGDVVLVIDGWAAFRGEYEQFELTVTDIAARGLTYGVHVVVTANRWPEIRPALKDLVGTRLELRLGDPADSDIDRRVAMNVPPGRPGRGLTKTKLHFLAALPRIDSSSTTTYVSAGADDLARRVAAAWPGPAARPVRMLPERIAYEEVAQAELTPALRAHLMIGIDEAALEPVYLDFDAEPHLVVFGDGESGKSALLRTLARGITERYTPAEARIIVVDYRRSLLGVVPPSHLLEYAATSKALTAAATEVAAAMDRRIPGPAVTAEQLRARSWWSGPELFVLVDDYDLVATQSGNPLLPLADLLPQAKDIGLHVVVVRRSGGAARSLYDPIIQRIRELGMPGLLLSGSKDEGPLVGSTKPMALPPGRGQLVTRRGVDLVQVAWSDTE